jgi:DNA-binding Lrp family transcriptional regulator
VIIDPIDLNIIRQLELHGSVSMSEIISKFHITRDEILLRIKNFEDSGFISRYGVKLFLPRIAGGKWYWICVAIETRSKIKPERTVPYLEEIVENNNIPGGSSPDLSLLFYTQNPKEIYKKIYRLGGVKYAEIYKIAEYDIAMPQILLKEDWQIIARFLVMAKLNYAKINEIISAPTSENDVKLSHLMWTRRNRKGIISVYPNFNWGIIKNFAHLHVAISTRMRVKELRRAINKLPCSANITSRFKKKFLQVEFDIWGFSDLQRILSSLLEIERLTIEGCSFAFKNQICNEWIKDYINKNL